MQSRSTFRVTCAAILTSAVLSGCSQKGGEPSDDPYRADIEYARRTASSAFERAVLQDDEITREEYDEAVRRFLECVDERGVEVKAIQKDGGYVYEAVDVTVAADATIVDCQRGTIALIEWIYNNKRTNPERLPAPQLIYNCLARHGVVASGYTLGRFEVELRDNFAGSQQIDPEDSRVERCLSNPAS